MNNKMILQKQFYEENFDQHVHDSFVDLLPCCGIVLNPMKVIRSSLLGYKPLNQEILELSCIMKNVLVRVRRLHDKNLTSRQVARISTVRTAEAQSCIENVNDSRSRTKILYDMKKVIQRETGALDLDAEYVFRNPDKVYIQHCTPISIRRYLVYRLMDFYKKYTGLHPIVHGENKRIMDQKYFDDLFVACEVQLDRLCKLSGNNLRYYGMMTEDSRRTFLRKTIREYECKSIGLFAGIKNQFKRVG